MSEEQLEAKKPESGLSKGFFLEADKTKAKKARQRAARAQAAAQTAEVRHMPLRLSAVLGDLLPMTPALAYSLLGGSAAGCSPPI